jgi:hypothetical protein
MANENSAGLASPSAAKAGFGHSLDEAKPQVSAPPPVSVSRANYRFTLSSDTSGLA